MGISKVQPMRPALDACIDTINEGFDPYIEAAEQATEAATEAAEAANLARESIQTDLAAKADKTGTYSTLTAGGTTPNSVTDSMLVQTGVKQALRLPLKYKVDYIRGFLKSDGTIDTSVTFQSGVIRKYDIPSGATEVLLSGIASGISGGAGWCALWTVVGTTMLTNVQIITTGQVFNCEPVSIPTNATEIWVQANCNQSSDYFRLYYDYEHDLAVDVQENKRQTTEQLLDYVVDNGFLKDDGTIDRTLTSSIGALYKYVVPDGVNEVHVYGDSGLSIYMSGFNWCILWTVSNGAMVSYVPALVNRQRFDFILPIESGVTEIWAYKFYKVAAIVPHSNTIATRLANVEKAVLPFSQWNGKVWYAYGTSITNVSNEGKYPTYLAQMAGMTLVNKGISGGGIGDLGGYSHGQVYDAICNITDGKLNADLITLETGANDTGANVPLGSIYDTGTSTLAGCLNDCLRYLQENTNAQIAVLCSPATKTVPTEQSHMYYEWAQMVKEICYVNRVHFIDSNNNMGVAKLNSSNGNLYVVDNIHQTNLGGYIMAENIWYQLRNIPCFYTAMPS